MRLPILLWNLRRSTVALSSKGSNNFGPSLYKHTGRLEDQYFRARGFSRRELPKRSRRCSDKQAHHRSQASWVSLDLEDVGLEPAGEHSCKLHMLLRSEVCLQTDRPLGDLQTCTTFSLLHLAHLQLPMGGPTAELGRCAPPFSRGASDAGAAISAKGTGGGSGLHLSNHCRNLEHQHARSCSMLQCRVRVVLQVVRTFNY